MDLKADPNTDGGGEGGGREEGSRGEVYEAAVSGFMAGFVQYDRQATQIPEGSS